MGLKVTSQVYTNKGLTTEMYINIQNISIDKNERNSAMINQYLNKSEKDLDVYNTCISFDVPNIIMLDLNVENLSNNYVYELAYNKIKEFLIGKGLTVEDLM
jgi:hypothetical protein